MKSKRATDQIELSMKACIRPYDYLQLLSPISPVMAFIVPWMAVLIGQELAFCRIIVPTYSSFYFVIIGNMISAILIAFFIQTFFPYRRHHSFQRLENLGTRRPENCVGNLPLSKRFKRVTFLLLSFYIVLQLFQVFYFHGFPLYWLLSGESKTYFNYGISSLNGFLNAIYLFLTTLMYLIYLQEKKKRYVLLLILMLSLPILLVCRQLLMCIFLQIACCMLLYQPKALRKIALCFVGLLFAFMLIGNIRTGIHSLTNILRPEDYIPESCYSLLWIYAYIVTPFNNLNASIDYISPLGMPYYEIASLLPSVMRLPEILGEERFTGFALVHENMNVSSFYLPLILDFGQVYAFCFMAVFQVFLFLSYRRALKASSWVDIVEYSVLYMISILSIFTNLLLFLPVIAQIVLIKLFKYSIPTKRTIRTIKTIRTP